MIYLFYIACVILFIVSPCNCGVSIDNMAGIFTYQFMHANILHLAVNILSLALMYNPIKKLYEERFSAIVIPNLFIVLYLFSIIVGGFCAMPTPTVGASGMVFFLLGMLIILNPTLQQLKNYIYVAIAVIVSIIFGNSNVALHVLSFVFGALYTITLIAYDNRRIKDSE